MSNSLTKSKPIRFAFCGASGTGKTTMATWLAETLGVPINPVGSRSTAAEMGFASPYDVDAAGMRTEFQLRLQSAKIAWETGHQSFVTDRTPLDELVYTMLHGVKGIDEAFLQRVIEHTRRYTHVVYCPVSSFCNLGNDPARLAHMTYQKLFDAALCGTLKWVHNKKRLFVMTHEGITRRRDALTNILNKEWEEVDNDADGAVRPSM